MISYFLIGFMLWFAIYISSKRYTGIEGVLNSQPHFLLYNLFLWPLGMMFLSFVMISIVIDILKKP